MHYKFFANSQKSWKAMYDVMFSAKKSIYLEMYIFQDDMIDFNFLALLKEKAKNGVRVRVILDSFGSNSLTKNSILEIFFT
jgi:cardiolipin synthase A/B